MTRPEHDEHESVFVTEQQPKGELRWKEVATWLLLAAIVAWVVWL